VSLSSRVPRAVPPIGLVLVVLLASCVAATPDRPAPADAPPGGQANASRILTVATTSDAVSFHPYKVTDSASRGYQGLVYAGGLVRRNPHDPSQFEPELAERWEISPDRRTYTFHLRADLRWSDGQPITAEDFRWTYEQARAPENGYPYASNLEPIASYEAPDSRTVVITLKEPLVIGLESADVIQPLPKHVWERLDWNDAERNPEIMAPTVVSGPFKLKEWQRDAFATFVANELYFRGRPKLDGITYQIVGTNQIAWQKLRAGEVDQAGLEPEYFLEAKQLPHLATYEWWPAAARWDYIGYNLRRPLLQDVTVRRALAHALDRQALADRLYYGLAEPSYGPYPPSCWCYTPDLYKYEYDPGRARELLAQAGWQPGPDGRLVRNGQPFRLRLLFGPNSNRVRERIATVAQAELRQLGIEVEIQAYEWAAFLDAIKRPPYDWDLVVLGWNATVEPHWMYQIWSEQAIPALNAGAYVNKRVEALYAQAVREFDLDGRKALYAEIQREITRDAPYIFLTVNKAFAAIHRRVGGIEPTPLGISHNLHEWYIR